MRHSFLTSLRVKLLCATFGLGLLGFSPVALAREVLRTIERIEISGVSVFSSQEVESALELQVGDPAEKERIDRTIEGLKELYRQRGFQRTAVSSAVVVEGGGASRGQAVLRFQVNEGLPTRIASVAVTSQGATLGRGWMNRLELKAGDILDQEKLSAAKRALVEYLVDSEFMSAKVEDLEIVETSEPREGPEPPEPKDLASRFKADRWVKLNFRVNPGEKATFGFRGNQVFTRTELLAFITDQRALGFGKDYVASIKKRLEDEYRTKGYAQIRIDAFVFEAGREKNRDERHITFEISEGPRVEIERIEFDGNSAFTDDELRDEFFERAPLVVQRGYYADKDVQKAAELLLEWVRSQGHLGAKLVAVNREFVNEGKKVALTVYLYEGDRTTVRSIRIAGASALSEEEIARLLGVKVGEPLNLFDFDERLENLKSTYRARGFLNVRINNEESDQVVQYSSDNREADILVELAEGIRFKIGKIEIQGLTKTRPEVVRREVDFKSGDVLEESRILTAETRLRRLGVFSEATIRTSGAPYASATPGGPAGSAADTQDLLIAVQEGSPGVVAGGAGFRQDLGVRTFGQTGYTNLFGRNHEVNLNLNLNYREWGGVFCGDERGACFLEGQAQLSYIWPWFLGDRTTFRPRLQVERTRYVQFDLESFAVSATWERRLFGWTGVFGGLTYSLERTRQFNALAEDDRSLTIGALIPNLRLDFRDNPLTPTRGFFAFTSFELADPALGSQNDPKVAYYRFQLRADQFVPLARHISLFLSFRTGYARNNVVPPAGVSESELSQYALPLAKQFALGGVTSLRGFQEQQFNFQQFNVLGVISYVNYRSQLDLPFAGALRFGPFLDAGNLLIDRPNRPSYSLTYGLKFGSGFGFHYQSPVGPVNFDVGFALGPVPAGESRHRFYFSIGLL